MPWLDIGSPVGAVHYRGQTDLDPATAAALSTMFRLAYEQYAREGETMPLDLPRPIPALTLTQPWATLVAVGAKTFETRSWSTSYRGWLAIHAAKGFPAEAKETCTEGLIAEALYQAGFRQAGDLPVGAVLAVCRLTGYFLTPLIAGTVGERFNGQKIPPSERERAFGDYSPGRYAWRLEEVQALADPVPTRGALGLWRWTPPQTVWDQLPTALKESL